jgi:hypothetical protein
MTFTVRGRATLDINREIVSECIRPMFLPKLHEFGGLDGFAHEDAVRFMLNCLSPAGEAMLGLLQGVRVRVITWSYHTTQIFQELDILVWSPET